MDSTSDKILAAAKKVFQEKGMAGARMQDIADEAGINKALLHYYFKNKEQLFFRIFSEALNQFFPKIIENIVRKGIITVPPKMRGTIKY